MKSDKIKDIQTLIYTQTDAYSMFPLTTECRIRVMVEMKDGTNLLLNVKNMQRCVDINTDDRRECVLLLLTTEKITNIE